MPTPTCLLEAVVRYLLATPSVTSLLAAPAAIHDQMANWGDSALPFLVVESYREHQPGESAEDEVASLSFRVYARSLAEARAILVALAAAIDSPNINPSSIRAEQWAFSGGTSTGVMKDDQTLDRDPYMVPSADGPIPCYEGGIDYQIWITPAL